VKSQCNKCGVCGRHEQALAASGGATPGRARSNALAKKLLPWLAPWLTEIFTFGPSQSSQLYDRTDLEMKWLS